MTAALPAPLARRRLATAALALALLPAAARAVPSFARQTGFDCVACHLSWPELTSVGRQFKLGGYTLQKPAGGGARPLVSFAADGEAPLVPLAAFVQASLTHTRAAKADGADPGVFTRQDEAVLQEASLLLAGRLADHAGGFVQWSYDGLAHHAAVDNVDLRLADRRGSGAGQVLYGLSLNNSPTVSDVFNSTPVWGFPFASSAVAVTPAASTLIQEGLAQQVAGLTAYALWHRTLYAELGGYRTADGAFSLLRAGIDRASAARLRGTAPYWRLALQHEWDEGEQSLMVGAFGLAAERYPDPAQPSGATDRYRDVALDAQYQFVTERHRIGAQFSAIRERQDLQGSLAAGGAANPRDRLTSLAAKLSYYYRLKYGASLGYQRIGGDADAGLYAAGVPVTGSRTGRPDSEAVTAELDWLPWRDRRLALQVTHYPRFNGARRDYDGFGRNAGDNDTLFLFGWFAF